MLLLFVLLMRELDPIVNGYITVELLLCFYNVFYFNGEELKSCELIYVFYYSSKHKWEGFFFFSIMGGSYNECYTNFIKNIIPYL